MKLFQTIVLIVLILLSLSAGAVKIMEMPQEVAFFAQAGLSATSLMILGVVQIAGGSLAIFQKTRRPGVTLVGAGFLVSSIVIFMTGNIGFGVFSLLPVILAAYLVLERRKA